MSDGGTFLYVGSYNSWIEEAKTSRSSKWQERFVVMATLARQWQQAALNNDHECITALNLLEEALFLGMNGERPPGAPADPYKETWSRWFAQCEALLRKVGDDD